MNNSPFLQEIYSLPGLVHETGSGLGQSCIRLAGALGKGKIGQIILMGCGDSHHAAIGARLAFQQIASIPCQAMTALEMARYQAGQIRLHQTGRTLVIGISASGQVSRTIEALNMAKLAGATTIALTGDQTSELALVADHVFHAAVPQLVSGPEDVVIPGARSYFLSLLALYNLAIRLGTVQKMTAVVDEGALISELLGLKEQVKSTITINEPYAEALITDWVDVDRFVFCGSGPNFGTALFSAAKVIEASGDAALGQDLEEWAHLQYFENEIDTPTFVISAARQDGDRALEIITAAKAIGRRVAVVSPLNGPMAGTVPADVRFMIPGDIRECFSPMVMCIPGLLLAAYRAKKKSQPYFRGFGGGRSREGGGGISRIRTSQRIDTSDD